jgi:hypothetical protein
MKYEITYRNGSKLTIEAHWITEDEEGYTVCGYAECGIAEIWRLSRKHIEKIVEV